MEMDRQIVVIGAGITGLACAFRLQQLGATVTLLEASDRVGGAIETVRRNGFLFETGPQCPRFPLALWQLVQELGLAGEFIRAGPRANRWVVKNGEFYAAPLSPFAALTTRLIGLGTKWRLVSEPFRHSQPPPFEESLADFVRRKFGDDLLDYLVEPFVSAVFFSAPEDLGMESALPDLVRWEREHGSVVRGGLRASRARRPEARVASSDPRASAAGKVTNFLPPLGSFRSGLAALTDKLAERLGESLRLRAPVESICPTNGISSGGWRVHLRGGEELTPDSVVIAAPAFEAAALLRTAAPPLSALLAAIPHSPLAVVSLAYDSAQARDPLDGFGFVVPRREGLRTISVTFNSSLFAGRAPAGKAVLTAFARPLANESFASQPPDAVAQIVEREVASLLGISGSPMDRVVRIYPNALPQLGVGHARRMAQVREMLPSFPGLHLAGNYIRGRSLGDCVESGNVAAEDAFHDIRVDTVRAKEVGRA